MVITSVLMGMTGKRAVTMKIRNIGRRSILFQVNINGQKIREIWKILTDGSFLSA